jgi:hypothetical protein
LAAVFFWKENIWGSCGFLNLKTKIPRTKAPRTSRALRQRRSALFGKRKAFPALKFYSFFKKTALFPSF